MVQQSIHSLYPIPRQGNKREVPEFVYILFAVTTFVTFRLAADHSRQQRLAGRRHSGSIPPRPQAAAVRRRERSRAAAAAAGPRDCAQCRLVGSSGWPLPSGNTTRPAQAGNQRLGAEALKPLRQVQRLLITDVQPDIGAFPEAAGVQQLLKACSWACRPGRRL